MTIDCSGFGSGARGLALVLTVVLLAVASPAAEAVAQGTQRLAFLGAPEVRGSEVLARDGYAVVIDLDENRLHFVQGRTVLWSAPVATGMGLRLQTDDRRWTFSTPAGVYEVQHKEENPSWYAPDWYFIENKLPVPPPNDARRRFPGGLGAAAVYIGKGLAIHGTDKPDLLGQRVSHGCIRLSNDDAQRLFHNVQVGTKIIIVGGDGDDAPGELVPGQVPGAGPADARTERLRREAKTQRERMLGSLRAAPMDTVVARLDAALNPRAAQHAAWPALAGELVRRAVDARDVDAAAALLRQLPAVRDRRVAAEYATFLVDLAERGGTQAVRALASVDDRTRERAAREVVATAIALYNGAPTDAVAPWPSRYVRYATLERDAAAGLGALTDAETAYRETLRPRSAR